MLPDNHDKIWEDARAAIWGISPPVDVSRNLIYIANGNLYSAPKWVTDCQSRENNQIFPHPDEGIEPDNHSESFLALDLESGKIKWYRQ